MLCVSARDTENGARSCAKSVRGVPALVHQRRQRGVPAADLVRGREAREVSLAGVPRPVRASMRRDGPVAKPVRILPRAVAQVEAHLRASVRDPHRGERPTPHLRRVLEREIRVEIARQLAAERVGEVPRLERVRALLLLELLERRLQQRRRGGFEPVEHLEASLLVKPLRLRHFHVVKVFVPQRPRESVALGDDLGEAVREEKRSGGARRLPARLSH
eukprot:25120-Pelagococcus_subviridis.AAC.2